MSIVIPIKDKPNEFAVTIGKNLTIVTWDGTSKTPESVKTVVALDEGPGKEENQFNDGKVDGRGRLWVGTMGPVKNDDFTPTAGSLYSIEMGKEPVKHFDNVSISNGLIWNQNYDKMFYIDSPTRKIDVFDFDLENGALSKFNIHNYFKVY